MIARGLRLHRQANKDVDGTTRPVQSQIGAASED